MQHTAGGNQLAAVRRCKVIAVYFIQLRPFFVGMLKYPLSLIRQETHKATILTKKRPKIFQCKINLENAKLLIFIYNFNSGVKYYFFIIIIYLTDLYKVFPYIARYYNSVNLRFINKVIKFWPFFIFINKKAKYIFPLLLNKINYKEQESRFFYIKQFYSF